ncbi:SDR family NAD(P)-dependent oxidoreductase [Marivita sp. XM-24bin2]|uniref:SDR family NAD(P)-dependent oxidoreductase n=1 Tax=unclassified Marivita TaxID=2632480 RepID=UPI000D7B2405|nr:SDR family NAD(P)-dependent oxidoreductase [Marivita sp. XM-24bin2]MCR9111246.1 SDR family NAD(P)-dependent oxidoreductase [Paracoccaceae bacterium]PWL37211.1 MAG: short-chain dehydrogenase [Marivita sp. XM-24bin2]
MHSKSILITGCSSGIGLDTARRLKSLGWTVFASCRAQSDCEARVAEGFSAPQLDYEDPDSIARCAKLVLRDTGGGLDAVFHNGAYALPGPLEDIPADGMRSQFEANFLGWHDLNRHLIPSMRSAGSGRILLNSSVLGLVGMKYRGPYVATKFALEGYADVLRMEMANTGIKIVLIEPGPIETEFRRNAIKQFEKWVDWKSSVRRAQYEDSLLELLKKGGSSKVQWPASAVTDVVVQALTAKRPRARYRVTTPTTAMALARRVLPTRALDWVLSKG